MAGRLRRRPRRHAVLRPMSGFSEPYGQDEKSDQRGEVADCPYGLDRMDGGEHLLPRHEEQSSEGWIREQETRVRDDEGVQVGREDVPGAEAKVDPEVDLIGAERQEQSVTECGTEGDHGRAPGGERPGHASKAGGSRMGTLSCAELWARWRSRRRMVEPETVGCSWRPIERSWHVGMLGRRPLWLRSLRPGGAGYSRDRAGYPFRPKGRCSGPGIRALPATVRTARSAGPRGGAHCSSYCE